MGSVHLLEFLPAAPPPPLAESWAELCGEWALAASRARCFLEAERALASQQRLGQVAGSAEIQQEALQALAIARYKRQDWPGVDAALASFVELLPAHERDGRLRALHKALQKVSPGFGKASAPPDGSAALPVALTDASEPPCGTAETAA